MKFKGIVDCSNEEYHSEKKHLSSSNLKILLKDPQQFYDEKIMGNVKKHSTATLNAFAEGTLAHSLILEPHMVEKEFRFYQGFRKQGKDWEAFKKEHADSGCVLMSKSQKVKVENWVKSYNNLPAAVNLVDGGHAEHTIFGKLMGVPVKVRADYINIDSGYIADVKTTSNPTDVDSFTYTVNSFEYDLSAALYSMMFEQYYKKPFEFYFIVLGKRDTSCEVFKLSEDTRKIGESKVIKALKMYKECMESGIWKLPEYGKSAKLEETDYEILEV